MSDAVVESLGALERPHPLARRVAYALLASALLLAPACKASRPRPTTPIGAEASAEFAEAVRLSRRADPDRPALRAEIRAALERALAAEPGWVAPRRMLDDLASEELLGVEVVEAHRSALAEDGADARELYLAGRLEGEAGRARFERAVRIDPRFAWGHHGLAWSASIAGERAAAVRHAERALALAQSSWERSFFATSLARFLRDIDHIDRARTVLEARLAEGELTEEERVWVTFELLRLDLANPMSPRARAAYDAALDLLRDAALTETEVSELSGALRLAGGFFDRGSLKLELALAAQSSPVRDRVRAELMLAARPTPLALGLLERSHERRGFDAPAGRVLRAARFAAGEFGPGVDTWLAQLPRAVLGADGIPCEPRLRRVVESTRALEARSDGVDEWVELGDALIDAGWFTEARSIAGELAKRDLERALDLDTRASAGLSLIAEWRRISRGSDEPRINTLTATAESDLPPGVWGQSESESRAQPDGRKIETTLDGLLASLASSAAHAHAILGGETDRTALAKEFVSSPRMSYGPIGSLVHPGPEFSHADERAGLGRAHVPVPGVAAELDRLGRFGLFGQAFGDREPDATILPKVCVQEAQGVHLGVPWSGTVVWCESPDLESRAVRRGAQIAAAALHEGYWIDIDSVRREQRTWALLRREFSGPDARERIARVLASRGLSVDVPAHDVERVSRERTATTSLLGEAERVRLAVLADRGSARARTEDAAPTAERRAAVDATGPQGGAESPARENGDHPLGEMGIDELVTVTATHEQGHLCDRTRFLPISRHLPEIALFLLEDGFSPVRVARKLEFRAQLVSLCDSPDPRVPLAQTLDQGGDPGDGVTPHGAAYTDLVKELVQALDRELVRASEDYPEIDGMRTLVHQLHRLSPEQVRHLARIVAHKKRMLAQRPKLGIQ